MCGTGCSECGRARLIRARARSSETSEGGGLDGEERSDGRTCDEGADAVVDGSGEGDLKLVPELGVEGTGGRVVVTFGKLEGGCDGKVGAEEGQGGVRTKGIGMGPYECMEGHATGGGAGAMFVLFFLGSCVEDGV